MILVVGLGNPGREYERSRHNLGFMVLDRLAQRYGVESWSRKANALVARGMAGGKAFLLAKPQTYMNLSGRAVAALLGFYKIDPAECLVVVDDLDLPLGKVRARSQGSDGGHKGLRSIIETLGTSAFKRIRIGIGRPKPGGSVLAHVLGASADEEAQLAEAVELAATVAARYIDSAAFEDWSSP
ncbi:MAG: aminoacyl-tRNA hydrolase [Candidatus Lambdaproteobacteria bacterium]|nr:aminoacyl-tRNA hydrolase [Candidatus Lambdaproteobacteria bacterium]